jgi:hypothetical protein
LFGPRWGCSLAPITPPGKDEGDQLKQAIKWRDIEAVPRRSGEQANLARAAIVIQ